jgi:hypothetical protein
MFGDRLPEKLRAVAEKRMREAYHADTPLVAEARLTALAAELDNRYPGAATSLREGMQETLTILRLDVPPTLARWLRSTNPIESMISICRDHAVNVFSGPLAGQFDGCDLLFPGDTLQGALVALSAPQLDAGVVEAFAAEDGSFFARGRRVVFGDDLQFVRRGEVPALGSISPGPTGLQVGLGHGHSLLHQVSPYSCHAENFLTVCPTRA